MEEVEFKEHVIDLGMDKEGNFIIKTDAKDLPVDIVQRILNITAKEIVKNMPNMHNPIELIELKRELRTWKLLAFLGLAITFIAILKMKGVL